MTPADTSVRLALERLAMRFVLIALASLFLLIGVPQLWQLLSPFLIALIISALLQPTLRFLREKLHLRQGAAVTVLVLLVCAVAFILLYWFVSFVVVQLMNASDNASSIISSVVRVLQTATNNILDTAKTMPDSVEAAIRGSLDRAFQSLSSAGMTLASGLANGILSFAASLPYAFIYTNFLILSIFFFMGRYPKIKAYFQKPKKASAPAEPVGGSIGLLQRSALHGTIGYIRVQFLFVMLTFLLSWLYFQFLGFEYAMLIGLIAALLELIPQFGCGTLYIPWALVSFLIGAHQNGWLILGLYLGYCLLRRLTEPMLLGSNLGVSPLVSLIGMFVGMQLAGIPGLIAGPIVMVVLMSAIRARLFDATWADVKAVYQYLHHRWKQ